MTALALMLIGFLNLLVLGTVALLLKTLLRTLQGIEDAVWHVGEELRGGVGLRIGRSRTTRPNRPARRPAVELDPAPDIADIG